MKEKEKSEKMEEEREGEREKWEEKEEEKGEEEKGEEEKREEEKKEKEKDEKKEKVKEEKREISYDYEELKSSPEVVNMSPDTYLELQYPPHTTLTNHTFHQVTHSPCHTHTPYHTFTCHYGHKHGLCLTVLTTFQPLLRLRVSETQQPGSAGQRRGGLLCRQPGTDTGALLSAADVPAQPWGRGHRSLGCAPEQVLPGSGGEGPPTSDRNIHLPRPEAAQSTARSAPFIPTPSVIFFFCHLLFLFPSNHCHPSPSHNRRDRGDVQSHGLQL